MRVAIVLVFVAAIATHIQGYKIRVVRKHYKINKHLPTTKNESQHEYQDSSPVPDKQNHRIIVHKEHHKSRHQSHLEERGKKYHYRVRHRQHKHHSSRHNMTAQKSINVIPAPRINKLILQLCEKANKNILAVWKNVARKLGMDKGYPVKNMAELKKLTILIKTFVDLSKRYNFKQMPLYQILQLIDEKVRRRHSAEEMIKEESDALGSYESNSQIFPDYTDLNDGYSSISYSENSFAEKPNDLLDLDDIILTTPRYFHSGEQYQNSEELITNDSDKITSDTPFNPFDSYENMLTAPSPFHSEEYFKVMPLDQPYPEEIRTDPPIDPLDSDEYILTTPKSFHTEEYITVRPFITTNPDEISTEELYDSLHSDEHIFTTPRSYYSQEYITKRPFITTNSDEISTEEPYDPLNSDENIFTNPGSSNIKDLLTVIPLKPAHFNEIIYPTEEHIPQIYFEYPDSEKDAGQQKIDDLNRVVLALLPELLAHYSKCENEASPIVVAQLRQLVVTLEQKKCRQRGFSVIA